MVVINRAAPLKDPRRGVTLRAIITFALLLLVWLYVDSSKDPHYQPLTTIKIDKKTQQEQEQNIAASTANKITSTHTQKDAACPVDFISDLSKDELYPTAGNRHMVTPPAGGNVSLVCCSSTKGYISLILHHKWAPLGAERFLKMAQTGYYFESRVPLFRCTDACQFGLAGDPAFTKQFDKRLEDDPMWLPPGPDFRENEKGVRRYPSGVLTYAGSGKNSRSNQFVLTLKPNRFMGGGSPWEVPVGELVGNRSFQTLSKFYTGYGEKGPSQAIVRREGDSENVRTKWPHLDYITGCNFLESKVLD